MSNDTKADIPEVVRAEHDSGSGNQNGNGYYWDTGTLQWSKLSGTNTGLSVTT